MRKHTVNPARVVGRPRRSSRGRGHDILEQNARCSDELSRRIREAAGSSGRRANCWKSLREPSNGGTFLGIDTVEDIARSVPEPQASPSAPAVMGAEIPDVDPVSPVLSPVFLVRNVRIARHGVFRAREVCPLSRTFRGGNERYRLRFTSARHGAGSMH